MVVGGGGGKINFNKNNSSTIETISCHIIGQDIVEEDMNKMT